MMKRGTAAALLAALCVLLLCGCGGGKTETAEATAAPVETPAPTAEGYDVLGGSWVVGSIQRNGHVYSVHENEALADLYDTTSLTFKKDGTFVYFNVAYGYRGTYEPHGEDGSYLLNVDSSFKYEIKKGEMTEEEIPLEKKVQYLVTMNPYAYGENVIAFHEFDALMGKAKVEELFPLFEPEDGASGDTAGE